MEFKQDQTTLDVSTSAYPIEVIYRACYSFTARAYLFLEPGAHPGVIRVHIASKSGGEGREILGEFQNALIDYATRWSIGKETGEVRRRLLAEAFGAALSWPSR